MHEQRQDSRMLCADLVEVSWTTKTGEPRSAIANLEDISSTGVCLVMDAMLPAETEVGIRSLRGEFTGKVRYCRYEAEFGHTIGIQFSSGSRWSPSHYRPRHLLDPRTLSKKKTRGGITI